MNIRLLSVAACVFMPVLANASSPFVGIYQTIDDQTNTPKSIVALYEYNDGKDKNIAGRIIALYGADGKISETLANPTHIADNVKGAPKMTGLDIIWDMKWDADENEYNDGKVMDPTSGKAYSCVIWQDKPGVLNVRGKLGPFGRTQNWNLLVTSSMPTDLKNIDTSSWSPIIIK
ncbi:MAG: DUF2147 domain-containing protein [Alphaproteobacteria bacterium]|nr:DUF2147 domain-containing protein [Alphaproteobacteria bacterium]